MDITGKIIFTGIPREGVSKTSGNPWKTQDFVIETHDNYPRKCVFTVFGEDRLKQFNIENGGEYTVSFDIDAHEYNGRWFNDIRAWRVVPAQISAAAPAQAAGAQTGKSSSAPAEGGMRNDDPLSSADANDDLPF